MTTEASKEWIQLKEPKQFSRLLYTNPVCFLSTSSSNNKRNVMVISWLTATNNEGRFIMSINKRRHTASVLSNNNNEGGHEFSLSVPTKGMEELVRHVGRTSGKWGSKFVVDDHEGTTTSSSLKHDAPQPPLSKRQKKKQEASQRGNGVQGLTAVPFGGHQEHLFCVKGTVAHLACRVDNIISSDDDNVADKDHHLVMAHVTDASVHASYWDADKNLFRPESSTSVPPYLTFFGSQTFGYVVADTE